MTAPANPRDLDVAIAERVMGWNLTAIAAETIHKDRTVTDDGSIWQWNAAGSWDAFRPSTDIAAAWQVVEEMRRRGYALTLNAPGSAWEQAQGSGVYEEWYADFTKSNGLGGGGNGDTAAEAICKAALMTVGGPAALAALAATKEAPGDG